MSLWWRWACAKETEDRESWGFVYIRTYPRLRNTADEQLKVQGPTPGGWIEARFT